MVISKKPSPRSCLPEPEQVILAAAAITLAITQGRTRRELETLVNLLSLLKDNTQAVLAQCLINEKERVELEIEL